MLKTKNIILSLLLILSLSGFSQQLPVYNQVYTFPSLINPAMISSNNIAELNLLNRQQWANYTGAPRYNVVTLEEPIKSGKNKVAFTFINDAFGLITTNSFGATYGYTLKLNEDSKIRFGLKPTLYQNIIQFNAINVQDTDDPYFLQKREAGYTFDTDFGVSYEVEGFRVGLAGYRLIGAKLKYEDSNESKELNYHLVRHFMINGAYHYNFFGSVFLESGAMLYSSQGYPLHSNVYLVGGFENTAWLGINYQHNTSFGANIGIRVLESVKIGYAIEVPIANLSNIGNTLTHEILLSYTPQIQNIIPNKARKRQAKKGTVESVKLNRLKSIYGFEEKDFITKDDLNNVEFDLSKDYYVVLGTHSNKFNAVSTRNRLQQMGINSQIYYFEERDYYFLYSKVVHTEDDFIEEYNRLKELNINRLIKGVPWLLVFDEVKKE